jgi:large subunit ribosomal protein L17
MRHGNKNNHLSRTSSHRKALLANLSISLIIHKRITTTLAKAKALRTYIEPLLTRAKTDTTHSRRMVFSHLNDTKALKELFGTISPKIINRPGGYTRILKTGSRAGDNSKMCFIELVDFNEILLAEQARATEVKAKPTTRRGRRKRTSEDKTAEQKEELAAAEGNA